LVGQWYGKAGMLLRAFQAIGAPGGGDPDHIRQRALNSWPFEASD
jgi:hypothetical protein